MICWGERNCCGVFVDRSKYDRCDCLRDTCIRDFPPEERITVKESELDEVVDRLYFNNEDYLHEMDVMLAIKSISNNHKFNKESKQLVDRLAQRLIELNFDVEVVEVKPQGIDKPTHYVIFANYFSTPAKNVVLVYGHVDVPNVKDADGWTQHPFKLTQKNEYLYGNGLTTSKGPVLCWLQATQAWMEETEDLPVNLRFIIDTFDDNNNEPLRRIIAERTIFFKAVDLLITNTNLWITPVLPMLTTSHSGYIYFELEVTKKVEPQRSSTTDEVDPTVTTPKNDPLVELILLMNSLTDPKSALSEGLQRHVLPVTHHDWDILCQAEVGIMEYKDTYGVTRLPHEQSRALFLKHRWCMSTLVLHSVDHRMYSSQREFYKPRRIRAKFSVKLVPDQSVEYVTFLVRQHLDCAYCRLKCEHPASLRILDSLKPLNEARNAPFNLSARRAYERVYNVQAAIPDTVNVCMPMMNELRKYCTKKAQVVGLPFSSIHTRIGKPDEGMRLEEYQKNLELYATMLYEVAIVPPECKCTEIKDFCFERGKTYEHDFIRMMEPRVAAVSHVLYELDETEIENMPREDEPFPNMRQMLLGQTKKKTQLDT
ncbi:cytosolic non-specific dipeptidase-like [Drosophila montana]|uniref:cytosolic non-specific dipeptidase-like n=1 Tax=Drosophila montana TaxID=40370 RepID=UPI00313DFA00